MLQVYSNGVSEVILGKAIKQLNLPRDEIVVMTKVFFPVGHTTNVRFESLGDPDKKGYVNQHGLSRKHIFDSVKKSLERLQLDYIDVLQCARNISLKSLPVTLTLRKATVLTQRPRLKRLYASTILQK